MAALTQTAANVFPSSRATINRSANAGATIAAGQPVYLDTNGVWQLVDADLSLAAGTIAGLAAHSAVANQPLAVVTADPAFTHGLTGVTAGDTIWTSPTAGGLTKTIADLVSGVFTAEIGIAISATQMVVQPINSGVAHA